MLINCPKCSARVDAKKIAEFEEVERDQGGSILGTEILTKLLCCPSCDTALVSQQGVAGLEDDFNGPRIVWSQGKRVWPEPETTFGKAIPRGVLVSLDEARGCLSSGFYTSSVVMSGRALEAIARHFQVRGTGNDHLMLGRGLEQLHASGKIDDRLLAWGKELQEHRNLAAHATDHVFEQADAQDLFEFVNAICEYLFVLQDRYDRFIARKASRMEGAADASK